MHKLSRIGAQAKPTDTIALPYESRFLRRKKLMTSGGEWVEIDLPHAVRFRSGDQLFDGDFVLQIEAANEDLLEIRGDLPRLAWHIGNRHSPCQIGADYLYVIDEPVMKAMLEGLGASLREVQAPFDPEQGAYHSHDHR